AIIALVVAAALLAFFLTRSGSSAPTGSGRLVRIDPKTNSAVKTAAIGQDPTRGAGGAGHVWMTTAPDSSAWRVHPKTFDAKRISLNGTPVGIAIRGRPRDVAGGGVAYAAGTGGATRILTGSGQVTGVTRTGDAWAIASGPAGVWLVASDTAYRL